MLNQDVWSGVSFFIDEYVKPSSDDFAVVIYTPDSRESAAWVCLALTERGVPVRDVWMTPIRDEGIADRLRTVLVDPLDLKGRLIVLTLERETMSHDAQIKHAISHFAKHKRIVFRAISACEDLFTSALRASPDEIDKLNSYLLSRMMVATKLHVETPGGTYLDITLDNTRHQWISNRGRARSGRVSILPPGEVATFPADVSGIFVADFAFNLNALTQRDTRLNLTPVTVHLSGGRATEYHCADNEIMSFLNQCFRTYCAYNVGELGFGTNRKIGVPIPLNSHINERKPGIHLGFGQHNQDPGVVSYQCNIHLDLISAGGSLWIDDDPSCINLLDFSPAVVAHPANFRDEDVFSPDLEDLEVEDCCGILRSGQNGLCVFQEDGTLVMNDDANS